MVLGSGRGWLSGPYATFGRDPQILRRFVFKESVLVFDKAFKSGFRYNFSSSLSSRYSEDERTVFFAVYDFTDGEKLVCQVSRTLSVGFSASLSFSLPSSMLSTAMTDRRD